MAAADPDKPKRKPPVKKPTKSGKAFIEAASIPGVETTNALRIARAKVPVKSTKKTIVDNPTDGSPKNGFPNQNDRIQAYNMSQTLRNHIERRKQLALEFVNVTPEMVLGATAMRAFASIDGAYDEFGNFDMKLARESGAIHLIKKLKKTQHGFEAEFYSNETAQQELARYMGMEFAPRDHNDDAASLKAGVEAVAREIARKTGSEVTHQIRVQAWEKVSEWVQNSKARYSPAALEEVGKQYGKALPDPGLVIDVEAASEPSA